MSEALPTLSRIIFIDIVGFSKKPSHNQKLLIQELTRLVQKTSAINQLEKQQRVDLPTGDGIAMALWGPAQLPLQAALELAALVRQYNATCPPSLKIEIRTGINSGEIFTVTDINDRRNVVGEGINNTQRVMDFGDSTHILAAKVIADELLDVMPSYAPLLHDAGLFYDKHKVAHHIYNVFDWQNGNPATPTRNRAADDALPAPHLWKTLLDHLTWEADFLRHQSAECTHLLLALSKIEGGFFSRSLAAAGHDATLIRRSMRKQLGKGSAAANREITFSAPLQQLLAQVWQAAAGQHRDILEEDFVTALLTGSEKDLVCGLLTSTGVDPESVLPVESLLDGFASRIDSVDVASIASSFSQAGAARPVADYKSGGSAVTAKPDLVEELAEVAVTRPVGRPAAAEIKVALIVENGAQQGRRYDFSEPELFIVGRSPDANFVLDKSDPCVSRKHFMIEIVPPRCYIRDFGSLNGTFVNDEKCDQAELKDGDSIAAGQTRFRVSISARENQNLATCQRCGNLFARPGQVLASALCPACQAEIALEEQDKFAKTRAPVLARCCECDADVGSYAACDGRGLELSEVAVYLCRNCFGKKPGAGSFARVGSYQLLQELGKGGMGAVYLVWNPDTCRLGALKRILLPEPDAQVARRFIREMRIMSGLSHPNLVRLYEDGVHEGSPYFISEYLAGGCLSRYLAKKGGRLGINEAVILACDILDGLEFFHVSGNIHRDIKPSNILLAGAAGKTQMVAKIADFGLAKSFVNVGGTRLTRASEFAGSLYFTPPEQILNFARTGPAADIYSTGVTLYQLLTGSLPYDFGGGGASSKSLKDSMLTVLEEPVIPVRQRCAQIETSLAAIVEKAIAKKAEERYASAKAFKDELQHYLGTLS
ncbi:MAG: hypothetical protein CVV42_15120 [Candidatus Riflebacteria bacterium HGW-Riflebacteria-2]|nr:MAG: hypothetical protein CVV42_15120 [Candidatus Riflebacteria bacterium HGW-Riflebacteria-2]